MEETQEEFTDMLTLLESLIQAANNMLLKIWIRLSVNQLISAETAHGLPLQPMRLESMDAEPLLTTSTTM